MFPRFCNRAGARCKRGAALETVVKALSGTRVVDLSEEESDTVAAWNRHKEICPNRGANAARKAASTRRWNKHLEQKRNPKPEPTSADRMQAKLANAKKKLDAWTRKRDRAENAMKKWNTRVKRYATLAAKAEK